LSWLSHPAVLLGLGGLAASNGQCGAVSGLRRMVVRDGLCQKEAVLVTVMQ